MLDLVVSATLENMQRADNIAIDVAVRVFQRITHTGLGSEVYHLAKLVLLECTFHTLAIGKIETQHAEIVVIRQAAQILDNYRLNQCDLYVTLEPCAMCTGAISQARIRRLYFGASDTKAGAVTSGVRFFDQPTCHHKIDVYDGINHSECSLLLRNFFNR